MTFGVRVLFGSLRGRVLYGSGSCTFLLARLGSVCFLAKHWFLFGSFLLGLGYFQSLKQTSAFGMKVGVNSLDSGPSFNHKIICQKT